MLCPEKFFRTQPNAFRVRADPVFSSGVRASVARKIQPKDGMLSLKELHLSFPYLPVSSCPVYKEERGVFFRSPWLRFQNLNGRSVDSENHKALGRDNHLLAGLKSILLGHIVEFKKLLCGEVVFLGDAENGLSGLDLMKLCLSTWFLLSCLGR